VLVALIGPVLGVLPTALASAGSVQSPLGALEQGADCGAIAAKGPTLTDVNSQAGDGRITVGENSSGNLTVFKYPNPSFYNQVDYWTSGPNADGVAVGALPNEGSFAGLRIVTATSTTPVISVVWFKSPDLSAPGSGWTFTQTDQSTNTPVIVTTYHSTSLGLTVTDTDLATAGPLSNPAAPAAFVRDYSVQRAAGSPVLSAELIYYEHFDVIGSRVPYAPVEDTCAQPFDVSQVGDYEPGSDAIVQSWKGTDLATAQPTSEAFAFGFDAPTSAHQVGLDHEAGGSLPLPPADGYDQLSGSPYRLGDASAATGQVSGTLLSQPLNLSGPAPASVRLIIGAGSTPQQALSALQGERASNFFYELVGVDSYWNQWLSSAPMPQVPKNFSCPSGTACASPARIVAVAKRALISIRLAVDPDSGAIVASADTEEPYGEDWTRDGSYIDEALDEAGYHSLVTRHELFEAASQSNIADGDVLVPLGNWPQSVYGDGIPGGPIPTEIDETGFATWALYEHSTFLSSAAAQTYLRAVFPAISKAADWLTLCQDPVTGLECPASEDDNLTPSETLTGSGPDLVGLRSAVATADALGLAKSDPEVALWQQRIVRLTNAIDGLYLPSAGVYGQGTEADIAGETDGLLANGSPSVPTYSTIYSTGGYLVWPVEVHPYIDPRMVSETEHVLSAAMYSLKNASVGGYEGKALVASCKALPTLGVSPAQRNDMRSTIQQGVGMLAESSTASSRGFTTDTGMFGETWKLFGTGTSAHTEPENDMPHVWEESLYYMTALCAFPQ
jgi:hypothetical protein